MVVVHTLLNLETAQGMGIYNLSPEIQTFIDAHSVQNGQILICSRHTTTALAINEFEERLLEDIKVYLRKLAPANQRYLHNDLHLRDVPENEPKNAHSHLMAITLSSSEVVPIISGKLALGTYQSILLFELDGPRQRTVSLQIMGE
ncbi:secondary thiamine-phosphate synthase enzyme YjbQ [Acaryochloris sp. IP29b_bin.137]|uniref:secondary thiamine-phosphate synthase enzyme YjbQ n=1 Tax=Acaryochloris sp. IP29b_bin.137 TaxID=2969217 RepID=UPI0026017AFA|nr:secondary thiamine-phosphate synthase enzyme YjbQ [Acaryochloris sp. IP29b_bin.137]